VGVCFAGPRPAYSAEKVIELRFAAPYGPTHMLHERIYIPWAKEIETRTQGRVKVTFYLAETLAKAKDLYDAVVTGIADMTHNTTVWNVGRFPLTSVLELPLGIPSGRVSSLVANELGANLVKQDCKDVKLLMLVATDAGNISTVKKQVKTLADLKDLKIKVAGAQVTAILKALGGSPLNIPATDAYDALQKGMADGVLLCDSGVIDFRFEDMLSYDLVTNLCVWPTYLAMNKNIWNSLPPDIQKIIEETTGTGLAEKCGVGYDAQGQKMRDALIKKGGQILEIPSSDRENWDQKLRPIGDMWIADMESKGLPGRKVYDGAVSLIQKYSK
jgi:TRAP-type C4-dicarboxylate transport system substrate-binding protein